MGKTTQSQFQINLDDMELEAIENVQGMIGDSIKKSVKEVLGYMFDDEIGNPVYSFKTRSEDKKHTGLFLNISFLVMEGETYRELDIRETFFARHFTDDAAERGERPGLQAMVNEFKKLTDEMQTALNEGLLEEEEEVMDDFSRSTYERYYAPIKRNPAVVSVMEALQNLEEMGGPEGDTYADALDIIIDRCFDLKKSFLSDNRTEPTEEAAP